MSKKFNLLLLHQANDIHPRTWIGLKGPEIKNTFEELKEDLLKNQGWHKEKLNERIAQHLNCAHNTISRVLRNENEFYPIPIILGLLKFSKSKKKPLKKFKNNIEYLKVNSASAKPIKAVYKLNENLAKTLGAFMADGSLNVQIVIASAQIKDLEWPKHKLAKLKINFSIGISPSRNQHYINISLNKDNFKLLEQIVPSFQLLTQTHYNIELSDEYKDNVETFIRWIKEEFDIKPNSFRKKKNAWRVIFSNKILARYLTCFFEVKPGPKTYYAFEPEAIKKSSLKIRKAFAKGVLMFDGCVTKQSKILFSTVSQKLYNSIKEIWERDKIKFGKREDKRGCKILFTTVKNKKEKLLKYFEENTQKWKLLHWLSGNLDKSPIIKKGSFLSVEKILKILQRIKRCDAEFLANYFNCHYLTIRTHLKILEKQGKIKLSNHPEYLNNYVNNNITVSLKDKFQKLLFSEIKKKFKKDKNFAEFLGIHKGALSAWRVKKNRIPLYVLKEMCEVLDLNFNELLKNIAKTDREIAEII